jgi:protein-S-isoprenylcysteine O-methyltransferase Ste14
MRKIIKMFGNVGNLVLLIMSFAMILQLILNKITGENILRIEFLYYNETIRTISLLSSVVLILVGGVYATLAHVAVRSALSGDEVKFLVKTGPFRFVRHPFYLSLIIICFSTGLLLSSYIVLLAFIVVLVLLINEAKWEEEMLIKQFGDEYRQYQKKTGMFLPRIIS